MSREPTGREVGWGLALLPALLLAVLVLMSLVGCRSDVGKVLECAFGPKHPCETTELQ